MALALRPRFAFDLAEPSREVLARLGEQLGRHPLDLRRTRVPGGTHRAESSREQDIMLLGMPEAERRLWSPWLNIEVAPRDAGTRVVARFSPHPSVWTFFAFGYLGLSVATLFSLMFSWALYLTGSAPWTLGLTAAFASGVAAMFALSQIGQRLAEEQMRILRGAFDTSMREAGLEPLPREGELQAARA